MDLLLWLLCAGTVVCALAWVHRAHASRHGVTPRSARPARLAGLATCVAVLLALAALGRAVADGGSWGWPHALLAVALLTCLTATAWDWPTSWFRGLALLTTVGALLLTAQIGRSVVQEEHLAEVRSSVTEVDAALAARLPLPVPSAGGAPSGTAGVGGARTAQQQLALACWEAAGQLLPDGGQRADVAEPCVRDDGRPADGAAGPSPTTPPAVAWPDRDAPAPCQRGEADEVRGGGSSAGALPVAQRELSRARCAVAQVPGPAVTPAPGVVRASAAALAQTQRLVHDGSAVEVPLTDAVLAGGRALQAALTPPQRWLAVVPGPVGWVLLALAAAYGYRRLEILNAGQEAGPVSFATSDDADAAAALKHHLLKNVSEPGSQPGTSISASTTDLLEAISPPHSRYAVALVTFLQRVGLPARGHEVSLSTFPVPERRASSSALEILVSLRSRRTGQVVYSVLRQADDLDVAAGRAGYACAAWLLGRARAVPPALRWDAQAADAWYEATRLPADLSPEERCERWRTVVRAAPDSAQARVALGNALDLARLPLEAFHQYDRAVMLYDDYRVARYRRAISCSTIARQWHLLDGEQVERITSALRMSHPGSVEASPDGLLAHADRELRLLARAAPALALARRTNSRERALVPGLATATRARDVALSAALVPCRERQRRSAAASRSEHPLGATTQRLVERFALSRVWQVRYNLACLLSLEGDPAALEHLQAATTCPRSSGMSGEWVLVDPDLEWLRWHEAEAVDRVVSSIPPGGTTE